MNYDDNIHVKLKNGRGLSEGRCVRVMAVGPRVEKWTWLLDDVEIIGTVALPEGESGDKIEITPDANYTHLASFTGVKANVLRETYPANLRPGWPSSKKSGLEAFHATDGVSIPLR